MTWKKNDIVDLVIHDIGQHGEGIGRTADGFTFFIKDTVPGDRVSARVMKVRKNYGYARLQEVTKPSAMRAEPRCPVAAACGGCQLQMLKYSEQLSWKQKKVLEDLQRIGGFADPPMHPIIGMDDPWHYRNKAQFPVGTDRNGNPVAGFYAGRTHSIISCGDCVIGAEENHDILGRILGWMRENHISAYDEETGTGLVRHVLIRTARSTGEILVCLVINGSDVPASDALVGKLRSIAGMTAITFSCNTERTNVILGETIRVLWGQSYITDRIGEISYHISINSFYQVNPIQTEKLYGKVLEAAGLTGTETVMDLYCGIGTISLFLAQKAKEVYGVEIVPQAVSDARGNAERNGFDNVRFYAGKAEEVVPELYREKNIRADVVVVDPPRKGCDGKLLRTIIAMAPEKIVYVSCDPATLARDLKYLCGNGYAPESVQPVDMFPHTVHVETVVLMSKKK